MFCNRVRLETVFVLDFVKSHDVATRPLEK